MKGDWTAAELAAFTAWVTRTMRSTAVVVTALHPATVFWLEGVLGHHDVGPG